MNVSNLTARELRNRLKTSGLGIRAGAFVTRIKTAIPSVAEGVGQLYSDYPVAGDDAFADFHVSLERPSNLHRWFRPQVLFRADGRDVFKPLPYNQAFPMLEWGMNWCVSSHAHSYLMIHAAVAEKDGHAVILPAPPGSGKSTLCAALIHRGWRLLSDEMTLIRISDGKIVPVPRPVSLKNQSIEVIRQYVPDAVFSRAVSDTTKGTVAHMKPPRECILRAHEPALPGWVIFPKYLAGAPAQLNPMAPARAFMQVAGNAFNYSLLGRPGFETLASLIDKSRCYEFSYGELDEAIDIFAGLTPLPLDS